jgi:hypothetical protein
MQSIIVKFLFIIIISILFFSCDESVSAEKAPAELTCEELKAQCLSIVKSKGPDIVKKLMEEKGADSNMSSQDSTLFGMKILTVMAEIQPLENEMKTRCAETFKRYEDEMMMSILGMMIGDNEN